ncbi:helix-turn-helix transcriptional regulator [Massilia violaceinigra]|uniref:Helix-turn-helix transcriptional regulator n=1 Tax=Massilia violaceinigra TaxID=2045208 RepID=A0ABY4A0F2_9BURK|nr:helix-turn-helix transcriptional regulator [Massilia violaceinigra]UOD28225.1 helix-turn-helix transcriptional regulator [Massilia violaceinigra]
MSDVPVLRNALKVQRAMHGLTQAALAERIKVSRKSINAIETGNMVPSVVLALKLAATFNVPVETLFQLEPENP